MARQPVSALLSAETLPYTSGVVRRIMLEMIDIARANGFSQERLPAAIVDQVYEITVRNSDAKIYDPSKPDKPIESAAQGDLLADFKPSILVDLEKQRPMELVPIFCNMIARARRTNVDTPRLDLITAALKPQQEMIVKATLQKDSSAEESNDAPVYNINPASHPTLGAPLI